MGKTILILGGYGGVGRHLADLLVKDGQHRIVIGGRNDDKGKSFCSLLAKKYQKPQIVFRNVDARNPESLNNGLLDVDLLIVTATIPDCMDAILKACVQNGVDVIDILIRSDVVDQLKRSESQIIEKGIKVITQGGFHPGMILPMMKLAAAEIEKVDDVDVFMAMAPVFETAESTKEIFYETVTTKPLILKNGQWVNARYTDSKPCTFSSHFGKKNCYPLKMLEIESVDDELGIKNAGAYVGGFNWFIDNVVFTTAVLLGMINKELSQNVCAWLMFRSTKKYRSDIPRVEMITTARGLNHGKSASCTIELQSESGYLLTAQAVYSMMQQYFSDQNLQPGIHLMGKIINENKLLSDLSEMGVKITSKRS